MSELPGRPTSDIVLREIDMDDDREPLRAGREWLHAALSAASVWSLPLPVDSLSREYIGLCTSVSCSATDACRTCQRSWKSTSLRDHCPVREVRSAAELTKSISVHETFQQCSTAADNPLTITRMFKHGALSA